MPEDVSTPTPQPEPHATGHRAKPRQQGDGLEKEKPGLATAALVGIGVAIIEPELIPGILIGVGAAFAPKLLPALGGAMRPVVKGVVKAGYSMVASVQEMAAEARENMEDMVAEAKAERSRADMYAEPEQPAGTPEPHPHAA
jgi:hypothetical protein